MLKLYCGRAELVRLQPVGSGGLANFGHLGNSSSSFLFRWEQS